MEELRKSKQSLKEENARLHLELKSLDKSARGNCLFLDIHYSHILNIVISIISKMLLLV